MADKGVPPEEGKRNTVRITGILPPITTPFDSGGAVDLGALAANVERYNEFGLTGYVAFGSNGEAVHLTTAERSRVVEILRRTAAPGRLVIAGVNEQSTVAAIEATRGAAGAGADAVLVITPYFYRSAMTQDVLRGFFADVAGASPLPILAYNIPQNTGVAVAPTTLADLAGHDRIAGVKDSSGNLAALSDTLRRVPDDFAVVVGHGAFSIRRWRWVPRVPSWPSPASLRRPVSTSIRRSPPVTTIGHGSCSIGLRRSPVW